jgi:hypothetical protein
MNKILGGICMSICIAITSNQLEMVAEKLDNSKFKYKFLYESDDKYKTIQNYNLELLNDCLLFTGLASQMRANRMKIKGREADIAWDDMIGSVFREDRHVAVVNDYWDNSHMVLVVPTTFFDSTQKAGNNTTTLSEEQYEVFVKCLISRFRSDEGMNVVSWDEYNMDMFEDYDPNDEYFKMRQAWIQNDKKKDYRSQLYSTFVEAYKFRMITYYTKLRDFGLDDIMRKLRELGYLDERFNNELYLYEEEARRLLAKRLCAISYRDDIKLLMEEGIIKPETLTYNLNV